VGAKLLAAPLQAVGVAGHECGLPGSCLGSRSGDEALTNVVKHAYATRAEVKAAVWDGALHLEVRDDGMGGAESTVTDWWG